MLTLTDLVRALGADVAEAGPAVRGVLAVAVGRVLRGLELVEEGRHGAVRRAAADLADLGLM